jgi:hypothetical protein
MAADWKAYQDEAAALFRALGLEARTDVTIQGVRTTHDVDVLVRSRHAGFEVIWIVECKFWKTRVSKLHVLALREIVADVGADRGILLAESGFQSGAIEAAALTNVHIKSLTEARSGAAEDVFGMRLREIYDRISWCRDQYWEIPKDDRIASGLRADFAGEGYSGASVIELVEGLLRRAIRGEYPLRIGNLHRPSAPNLPAELSSAEDFVRSVEPLVAELEQKLRAHQAHGQRK